jgi:hypothetical protein
VVFAGYPAAMSDLTLHPTWRDLPCGRPIDDFSVRHAGRPVGRIYQTCGPQSDWLWSLHGIEPDTPCGHAPSLEDAKAAFRAAHGEWSKRPPAVKDRG